MKGLIFQIIDFYNQRLRTFRIFAVNMDVRMGIWHSLYLKKILEYKYAPHEHHKVTTAIVILFLFNYVLINSLGTFCSS